MRIQTVTLSLMMDALMGTRLRNLQMQGQLSSMSDRIVQITRGLQVKICRSTGPRTMSSVVAALTVLLVNVEVTGRTRKLLLCRAHHPSLTQHQLAKITVMDLVTAEANFPQAELSGRTEASV